MLATPRSFWLHVHEHPGAGLLLLIHLASWKRIADDLGHEALDVAAGIFEGVCRTVTSGADASALISMTVFGAYWHEENLGIAASHRMSLLLPVTVSTPTMTFDLSGDALPIHRSDNEVAPALYRRAQSDMERMVTALDPGLRYPALPLSWEDVMKAPG